MGTVQIELRRADWDSENSDWKEGEFTSIGPEKIEEIYNVDTPKGVVRVRFQSGEEAYYISSFVKLRSRVDDIKSRVYLSERERQ